MPDGPQLQRDFGQVRNVGGLVHLDRLGRALDRLLPVWFAWWMAVRYGLLLGGQHPIQLGGDFHIYRRGAAALLAGTDPWEAVFRYGGGSGLDNHFAALPTAAQLFVPFALIPVEVGLAIWTAITVGLAVVSIRRLGLPIWWLLFPPLAEGLLTLNPHVALLGLLLLGTSARRDRPESRGHNRSPAVLLARALAVGLKVYALLPIVARREWRAVPFAAALIGASIAIAPGLWISYLGRLGDISTRLIHEAGGGTSAAFLVAPGFGPSRIVGLLLYLAAGGLLLAVAFRDLQAAGWLAVPLMWPAAEYQYATFALPVARRLATFVIAMAVPYSALIGVVILALELILRPRPGQVGLADVGRRNGWTSRLPR